MTSSPLAGKPDISHWDFPQDDPFVPVYRRLLDDLEAHFEAVRGHQFSSVDWDRTAAEVLETFTHARWGLFRVFFDGKAYTSSTASQSLNVALVLFLYARANGWSDSDTALVVRAALLHDVGMLFLPTKLVLKDGRLDDRERAVLEGHPLVSHEKVKLWGESFESTQIALQHHEEWGGGGYPGHLAGEAIHPWARVAAVAIQFVARVTQRRYRNSLVGYEAMKLLIKDKGQRFDPTAVTGLVKTLGLNPPGSILLLSDGSIVRVHEMVHEHYLRPRVRVLIDGQGEAYRDDSGPLVDLEAQPQLYVARPVNFQDLLEAREHQTPG